ncbi:hypothetical protein [Nocardioides sp. L-11A]|uniref:hypothetical protein n=1 Tax=Nocardioides sp. L-11A TaxID=3043848 RepID=UPI00249B77AA|nr:hypothetical protein QJ852_10410 [Nocardioides sp. L-11A]
MGRGTPPASAISSTATNAQAPTPPRSTPGSGERGLSRASIASSRAAIARAVTATATSSVRPGRVRASAARSGTASTMPRIAIGWTSPIGPWASASTWKANPTGPSVTASSAATDGARAAARCWVDVDTADVAALASAKATARRSTAATLGAAGGRPVNPRYAGGSGVRILPAAR